MRADILGLRDDLGIRVKQAAGEILGLVDRDGAGGAEHRRAHLTDDGD